MAGSSFAEGEIYSYFADLDHVNRKLQWNPHRIVAERTISCDTVSEDRKQRELERVSNLDSTKQIAEKYAQFLSEHHQGRRILEAEDPGEYATEPRYWLSRAAFYKIESEKLDDEYYEGPSRAETPAMFNPASSPFRTDLDRAKCCAGNVARELAAFPEGQALLENEDHGESTADLHHWWDSENFDEALPEIEDRGDAASEPSYWRDKEKLYRTMLGIELQKTRCERARREADLAARNLATFSEGKALLEAEDHEDFESSPDYWLSKKEYYKKEYHRLREFFWVSWKRRIFGTEVTPPRSEQSPHRNTRARQSPARTKAPRNMSPNERNSPKIKRERTPLGSLSTSPNGTKPAQHTTRRRSSKTRYRRQRSSGSHERSPRAPPPSVVSRKVASVKANLKLEGKNQRHVSRRHPAKPNESAQETAYNIPTSPRLLTAEPITHNEPERARRRGRRPRAASSHEERPSASQSYSPISSRLRSK